MKIFPISDLHIDHYDKDFFRRFIKACPDADICCIAGDIGSNRRLIEPTIDKFLDKYQEVIFVLGNHDYYGGSTYDTLNALHKIKKPGFHWIENRIVEIQGQRFLGGTLWFKDEPEARDPKNQWVMPDFSQITNASELFNLNDETVEFLWNEIKEGDYVITHHIPSYQAMAERFRGSRVNCYFYNDLEALIAHMKPAVWHFGHTHDQYDDKCWNTRLICNPLGYSHEPLMPSKEVMEL